MVKKRGRLLFVALLCLTAVILTSCNAGNTEPQNNTETEATAQHAQQENTEPEVTAQSYPLPEENRLGYGAEYFICPSSTSNGYYFFNLLYKNLRFYDVDSSKEKCLCDKSGCNHEDEACKAWIGDAVYLAEYHGDIFAVRQYEDKSLDFIKKDLSTGNIEIIDTFASPGNGYYQPTIQIISYNMAVIQLMYSVTDFAQESEFADGTSIFFTYNLKSGELLETFQAEASEVQAILAMTENHAAVLYYSRLGALNQTEFREQYGEYADYWEYAAGFEEKYEIRLYDLDTLDYTVLADTDSGFIRYSGFLSTYGDQIVYACKDTIYLFDMKTLEERQFLKCENLVDYWFADNKIFYITGEENDLKFYYADIDDPVSVELKNGGNTKAIQFYVYCEGNNFFISNDYRNYKKIISKEDFYAERYENARDLPYR